MTKVVYKKFKSFNKYETITFTIGIILFILYICTIFWKWYDQSYNIWNIYNKNPKIIEQIKEIANNTANEIEKREVYSNLLPNATTALWGGSSYFYTFISNIFLAACITFFPFFKNGKLAQRLYFSSIVFIISVMLGFWTGIVFDPKLIGRLEEDNDFNRTIIWHAIGPVLGIVTIFWERKSIRISNKAIWCLMIYPLIYSFFMISIYLFGYKFLNLHKQQFSPDFTNLFYDESNPVPREFNSEINRGIVFYSVVSLIKPLGYEGPNNYVRAVLIIIMLSFIVLTCPIIGFIIRRFLRIKQPNQKTLPKLIFLHKDSKLWIWLYNRRINKNKSKPNE
ncbi:hypothetical protein RRG53_02085 [Mycoplasmopsis cynos]|uniref:MAGa3780 family membrane protein n=1 Tax=Mycoplasmopsis cynos TaxID=171284 RepID=UPI002AFDCCC4|nr:hypothetical protein [Mycoplasmopsis cynos]WQQ18832.1 hypothetical protein RRG53_02085 [Mycoplasmopsis cynos]